jgi:hypothetical protein
LPALAALICRWAAEERSLPIIDMLTTRLHVLDGKIWTKYTSVATDSRDLKPMIEIFYHMPNSRIILEMPTLLKLVKGFWRDDELIHGTVKLVIKCWRLMERNRSIEDADKVVIQTEKLTTATLYLTGLMHISFVNDPTSFLKKTFHFPRNAKDHRHPLLNDWLTTLSSNLKYIEGPNKFKAIRPIIPIISGTIKYVCENDELAAIYGIDKYFNAIWNVVNKLLHSTETSYDVDFKAIVKSNVIINLMNLLEKHPPEVIFPEIVNEYCCDTLVIYRSIEQFIKLFSKITLPKDIEEKHSILKTLLSLMKCEKFYLREIPEWVSNYYAACLKNKPLFKLRDILDPMYKIVEGDLNSRDFVEKYCNSDINIMSSMISIVTIEEGALGSVALNLSKILKDCKSPQLVDHILPFLEFGLDDKSMISLYQHNTFDKSSSRVFDEQGRPCHLWDTTLQHTTFEVINFAIEHSTLS